MTKSSSWMMDAAKGAIAGALASRVMGQVTTLLYERQDDEATKREQAARGGEQAVHVAAEKLAALAGRTLDDEQRKKVGSALHWATAIGGGALYGVLRRRVPGMRMGAGLVFGTAFWLVVDEWMNAALGFTPGPRAFPWQTHARGLAGHLAYGMSTELGLRAVDQALGVSERR